MSVWHVKDAKTRFRDLIEAAQTGPQVIRRRGKDVAVVLSIADWRASQPTLADLLLSDEARGDWLESASIGDLALAPPELARA